MNDSLAKFLACALVAAVSSGVLLGLRGRRQEESWLAWSAAGAWILRVVGAITLYVLAPHLVRFSDAMVYYLPETHALLTGSWPYNGFATSYSPLFHVLLAPALIAWPSPGAIVLIMLLAEGVLVVALLRTDQADGRGLAGSRTAWLIVTSPLQVYWVGIGGYNSILIAAFAGLGLVAIKHAKFRTAGAWGALAFLGCKALGLLAWPTLVLYGRNNWRRCLAPLLLALLVLAGAGLMGLDVLMPVRREGGRWAGGNLWVVAASFFPALYRAAGATVASGAFALLAFGLGTRRFWRLQATPAITDATRFGAAIAHLAWIFATFLLLSPKSMAMYVPMLAPFAAHVLVGRADGRLTTLMPWFALGAVATVSVESRWLPDMIASRHLLTTGSGAIVLAAELVRIVCLMAIARTCWTAIDGDCGRAPTQEGS